MVGRSFYQNKINRAQAQSVVEIQKYNKQVAKEKAQAKADKAAEEKRIYKKHKGEKLVYAPMGDSLAEGLYATKESKRYVSVLSKAISQKMGYNVVLTNGYAKQGTGLKDNGIPNADHVIANMPDLITVEFGTNDLNPKLKNAYSSPDEFKQRLTELIKRLKSETKAKIILVTTWNSGQLSAQYDSPIYSVAKTENIPVADISNVWSDQSTFGPKGYNSFLGIGDGWHPNDKGHREIAETIFKQAYDVLK